MLIININFIKEIILKYKLIKWKLGCQRNMLSDSWVKIAAEAEAFALTVLVKNMSKRFHSLLFYFIIIYLLLLFCWYRAIPGTRTWDLSYPNSTVPLPPPAPKNPKPKLQHATPQKKKKEGKIRLIYVG